MRCQLAKEDVRANEARVIIEKAAEKLEIEVTDEEVNTAIAAMARRYNRRFDRVRDELQQQGLLSQLAERIRQDKTVSMLLEKAKVTGVKHESAGAESAAEPT